MQDKKFNIDTEKSAELIKQMAESVSNELFTLTEKELELFRALSTEIELLTNSANESSDESIDIFRKYNARLGKFTSEVFLHPDEIALKEKIRSYTKHLEVYIATLPKSITLIQGEERFLPSSGERFRIRFQKRIKAFSKKIQVFGLPLVNFFRKLGRKEIISMPIWRHEVEVRQIYRYAFRNLLLEDLLPFFETIIKNNNILHYKLMQMDWELSEWFFNTQTGKEPKLSSDALLNAFLTGIEESEVLLKEAKNSLNNEIIHAGERAMEHYKELEKISGTIEYPRVKSSVRIINRSYSDLLNKLDGILHTYGNSSHFIFDDWRFDTALNGLSTSLLKEKARIIRVMDQLYKSNLKEFTASYGDLLKETESFIEKKGSSLVVLKKILKDFKSGFASLLIKSLSSLKSGALHHRISSIYRSISTEVASYPEKRVFVRKFEATQDVKDSEFVQIRPADILRFEILPEIEKELSDLSTEVLGKLEILYNLMTDIGTIAEFSIQSAVKQIVDKHEGEKNPDDTLKDGLARSAEKILGIEQTYTELRKTTDEILSSIINSKVENIQELRENEKVFALNMRLASALLKRRTRERMLRLKKLNSRIFNSIVMSPALLLKKSFKKGHTAFSKVVYSTSPETISAELSAYLSESKNAKARLPYIYQRLYLVEPINDELFYYNREGEASKIDSVISAWEDKLYSPVAILCEKGSGATSFINQYRKGLKKYPSVQIGTVDQIYTKEDFLGFLSKSLKLKNTGMEGIVEQLNASNEQIIFLEDLQNLYLRTVDGFNALKTLFSIMSLTNEKVLWINSCTRYAWEYLELTLKISAYFNTLVQLSQLGADAIRELILKRHIISGYTIQFYPNKMQLKSRGYKKLPAEQQQAYLEEKYFSNMNNFAKGNVSLALHFWLRSTKEVQDKKIIISSIYDTDYGFLNTLSRDQLVILTMICIHDGVNGEQLSFIMRMPVEEAKRALNQLYDDSIIVKRQDIYLINPLLYRQVVDFLKNKNFIQ